MRLSGGDAATQARVETYTERGDVVLDGDDRVASAWAIGSGLSTIA